MPTAGDIVNIVVREVDKAFGRTPGGSIQFQLGTLPLDPNYQPLNQLFFEKEPFADIGSESYHAQGPSYVFRGEEKRFVKVAGDTIFLPVFEVFQSSSARCVDWLQSDNEPQRVAVVERVLASLQNRLAFKLDRLVVHFVADVVTAHGNWFSWEENAARIVELLENDPCQIVLSTEATSLAQHFFDRRLPIRTNHVLNPRLGFILPRAEPVGIMRSSLESLQLMAWCDPKEGTFGLSAYSMVGMAITRPDHFSGIKFDRPHEAVDCIPRLCG